MVIMVMIGCNNDDVRTAKSNESCRKSKKKNDEKIVMRIWCKVVGSDSVE